MPSPQLANYLRSIRKRTALSQAEVAFLLGNENSAQVSRHEQFKFVPSLETALQYEAIFKLPVSEIFGGIYQEAERKVGDRAGVLLAQCDWEIGKAITAKRELLQGLRQSANN